MLWPLIMIMASSTPRSVSNDTNCSELIESDSVVSQPSLLDRLRSPALSDLCRFCSIRKVDTNRVSPSDKKWVSSQALNAATYPSHGV